MESAFFRAAVGAFIVNKEGKLLVILKHGYGNKWDIPKGGINQGETDLEALDRELFEELGVSHLKVLEKSKLSLVKIKHKVDWSTTEHIGQAWNNYWIRIDSDQVKFSIPNDEVEQIMWIDITQENIREYFNIHDDEGFLETLLPVEWERVRGKYFSENG